MKFHQGITFVGLLSVLTVVSLSVRAEDKKTAPAPVVRAAPAPVVRAAPAPVVRAPAAAPVVRAAPAPVVRAPTTATAVKPASTNTTAVVKPAATTPVKPAVTAVKPAAATTVNPSAMDRARNRIQSTLPADGAVRADPAKKPSMEGVKASEFKPQVKLKPAAEPPSPGTPNFPKRPKNDPALTNPLTR